MNVKGDCFTVNKGTISDIVSADNVDKALNAALLVERKKLSQKITASMKDVRDQVADLGNRVQEINDTINAHFENAVAGVLPAVGGETTFDSLADLATALTEETGDFNVVLGGAFELTDAPIDFNTKANVTLDLNGHDVVMTGEQTITAEGGAHLTITGNGGSLSRSSKARSGSPTFVALVKGEGSSLTLENCELSTDEDYAVVAAAAGTTLTINGGSIYMPIADSKYAAVETNKVTSTITGTKITGDVFPHDGANMRKYVITIDGNVCTNGSKNASTININNCTIRENNESPAAYLPSKAGQANTVKITGGTLTGGAGILNLGSNVTLTDVTINSTNSGTINHGDATYGSEKTRVQYPCAAVVNANMTSGYNGSNGSVTIESGTYTNVKNITVSSGTSGDGSNTPAETGVTINGGTFSEKLSANVRGDLFESEVDGKYVYTSEAPTVVVTAGTESTYGFPAETFGSIEVKGNYVVGELKKATEIVTPYPTSPEKQSGYYIYLNAEPWQGVEVRRKMNDSWNEYSALSANGKFLTFAGAEKVEVTDIDVKAEDGTVTTYHVEVTTTE